ncbi:ATP-binding protein [Mycobacterium canetti]|uniref:ATP-binding protein n=1 Tax=Mycobacterium canetti TaxID=78331 RepID=UPI0002E80BDE|nr:ATP-binding protein [Mycobacterium canetti]
MDDLRYDRTLLGDLTTLRFLDAKQSVIILGPAGLGKTHLVTALGHIAIRRRHTVLFGRADKLFTRLRAAWLDNTVDAEIRRLATIDVLIIDINDFALKPPGNQVVPSPWQATARAIHLVINQFRAAGELSR